MNHQIDINTTKCIGCGLCAKVCVANNIEIKEKKASLLLTNCLFCGQCSAVCPRKAISVSGYTEPLIDKPKDLTLDPQTVLDVIRFRRSIRQFQNKAIPEAVINQILEAGRLTHTAKNAQDVAFIVLDKEKDKLEQMAVNIFKRLKPFADIVSPLSRNNRIDADFFFFQAPIVILVLAKDKTNGILAAQNMEFVAEANGLGVLFSGYFTKAANLSFKMKKALNIESGKKIAMTLVLGYPNIHYLRSTQKEKINVKFM